jgi:hypothetical protein
MSDEDLENACGSSLERRESASKSTFVKDVQSKKQRQQRISTGAGMQLNQRDSHASERAVQ